MSGSAHQEAARSKQKFADSHHRIYADGYAAGTIDREVRSVVKDLSSPCSTKERGSQLCLSGYREGLLDEPPHSPVQLVLPLFQPIPSYVTWKEARS